MDLLVTGGLFLFGVVALVAVVFVIRSEPATKEDVSVPPPVPTGQGEPETYAVADEPTSSGDAPGTQDEGIPSVVQNHEMDEWQPLANGQFYELKNELYSLHEQAQGLEQRLKILVEMVERIEQAQDGRFPVEGQSLDAVNTPVAR